MNMQNMISQINKMKKEMMEEKEKIDQKIFVSKNSGILIEMKGTKELIKVEILFDEIKNEDKEMLEDMILVAINDVINQIENETNEKLGKYTQGMPGII